MTLNALYRAGGVGRYHAYPELRVFGQTNADHQGRCVQLLFALNLAPSVALIDAVAHHDVGEVWAGDLPGPFKDRNPEIAAVHAEAEHAFAQGVLGRDVLAGLDRADLRWLALVDHLDRWAFMMTHAPHLRTRCDWPHDWPATRKRVIAMAWAMGADVATAVQAFVDDLEAGL